MINALLLMSSLLGATTSGLDHYDAKGNFVDSKGRTWAVREVWLRGSFLRLDLSVKNQLVGEVLVDVAGCTCTIRDAFRNAVGACDAGWVLANSPIRRLLNRAMAGSAATTKVRDLPYERIEDYWELLGKGKYRLGRRVVSQVRGDTASLLDVTLDLNAAVKPEQVSQPPRTLEPYEASIIQLALEGDFYPRTQFTCSDGFVPGIQVVVGDKPGVGSIRDVVECTSAAEAGVEVPVEVQLSGVEMSAIGAAPELCGSQGSLLWLSKLGEGTQTIQVERDVGANRANATAPLGLHRRR